MSESSENEVADHAIPPVLANDDIRQIVFRRRRIFSYSNYECRSCNRYYRHLITKKTKICYDCILEALDKARILRQGFDFTTNSHTEHVGTCIICLNENQMLGRKYLICQDCLINRLADMQLISFSVKPTILTTDIALTDNTSSILNIGPEWIPKSKLPCDGCLDDVIDPDRKQHLCLECVFQYLLKSKHFKFVNKKCYNPIIHNTSISNQD